MASFNLLLRSSNLFFRTSCCKSANLNFLSSFTPINTLAEQQKKPNDKENFAHIQGADIAPGKTDIPPNQFDKLSAKLKTVHRKTKRWYNKVSVEGTPGYWKVIVDDRFLSTPEGSKLIVPSKKIAQTIASEFEKQREFMLPATMPMTTLASTALDSIPEKRAVVIKRMMSYFSTDTVACRTPSATNAPMRKIQDDTFYPIVKYFSSKYHVAIVANSDLFLEQPKDSIDTIQWHLFEFDDFELAAMETLTTYYKSLILALCVKNNFLTSEEGFHASHLEETWNQTKWGRLEGVHDVEETEKKMTVSAVTLFLRYLERDRD